jgi:hypothetical protein
MGYWLLVALIFSVPLAASLLAGLLGTGSRAHRVPVGVGLVLVAAFVALLLVDNHKVVDAGAIVGGGFAYALAAALLLGASYGVGVWLRRRTRAARVVIGILLVAAGAVAHFYATLLILLVTACEGLDTCLE